MLVANSLLYVASCCCSVKGLIFLTPHQQRSKRKEFPHVPGCHPHPTLLEFGANLIPATRSALIFYVCYESPSNSEWMPLLTSGKKMAFLTNKPISGNRNDANDYGYLELRIGNFGVSSHVPGQLRIKQILPAIVLGDHSIQPTFGTSNIKHDLAESSQSAYLP